MLWGWMFLREDMYLCWGMVKMVVNTGLSIIVNTL